MRKISLVAVCLMIVVFSLSLGYPSAFANIKDTFEGVEVSGGFGGDVVGVDGISGTQSGLGTGDTFIGTSTSEPVTTTREIFVDGIKEITVTEYPDGGRIEIFVMDDGRSYKHAINSDGETMRQYCYDEDSKLIKVVFYNYDEDGKLTGFTHVNPDGSIEYTTTIVDGELVIYYGD